MTDRPEDEYEQPPELDDEDGALLDAIWDGIDDNLEVLDIVTGEDYVEPEPGETKTD